MQQFFTRIELQKHPWSVSEPTQASYKTRSLPIGFDHFTGLLAGQASILEEPISSSSGADKVLLPL